MSRRARTQTLFGAYNAILKELGLAPYQTLSRAMEEALDDLDRWCQAEGVDTATYMRARAGSAKRRIPCHRLKSPKFVARYRGSKHEVFQARQQAAMRDKSRPVHRDTDPRTELRLLAENIKAMYAGTFDHELCMLAFDLTLGWNPKSEHCQRCPIAERCRDNLDLDLRNLRNDAA